MQAARNFWRYWKVILIIPILAIIITSVVRGTTAKHSAGAEGQRVVLATSAGVVKDKSFNQDAFLGLTKFMDDYYGLGTEAEHNNFVEGTDSSKNGILNNYKTALLKGADALVLPGYTHIDPLSDLQSSFLDDKTLILIDGFIDKPNVISIIFNAEFAGLQAGFDASVWATRPTGRTLPNGKPQLQGDLNNDGEIRIGTFGGASMKYSVDYFLFGLFVGMELFNQTIGADEGISVGFANASDGHSLAYLGPENTADRGYFTNSFSVGDAIKSGILGRLIDTHHADILFPVAGPQVNDVISYQSKPIWNYPTYSPYIIGVDSDQTLAYPQAANNGRFLTSAVKNIHGAVYASLAHAKTLRQKTVEEGTIGLRNAEVLSNDQIWDGTQPKPQRNWAGSIIGGTNKIQQHALKLFDKDKGEGTLTSGEGYDDVLIKIYDFYHDDKLSTPQQYLSGAFIKKVVDGIVNDVKKNGMIDQEAVLQMKSH